MVVIMLRYRTYPTRFHQNVAGTSTPRILEPYGMLLHTTEGHGMGYLLGLLSGEFARGDGVTPSVHFLISLKGETYELAPWQPGEAFVCWHAGRSEWMGLSGLNRYLLGVEIEHVAGEAYPAAQVRAIEDLMRTVAAAYRGVPYWRGWLLEHKRVAPTRKTDPTSRWAEIMGRVYAAWKEVPMSETDVLQAIANLQEDVDRSQRASSYRESIMVAIANGDPEEAARINAEALAWNKSNPGKPPIVTGYRAK
ncbi:MAG: N-acetylmuramoyl-L-alanine amidase [Actinobacteria bacterium]|nr:N-acetylmuramoyl-L-alanine amidase [Actinomycetota bacterium]